MGEEISVQFFDGIYELERVCSIYHARHYTSYYIYDVYPDNSVVEVYSGIRKSYALDRMRETGNMTVDDERRMN